MVTDEPSGFKKRVKGVWLWVKVVLLVVVITLFIVLLLQNITAQSKLVYIVDSKEFSTALVVGGSFVTGVLVTLLVVFLRRGFGKG